MGSTRIVHQVRMIFNCSSVKFSGSWWPVAWWLGTVGWCAISCYGCYWLRLSGKKPWIWSQEFHRPKQPDFFINKIHETKNQKWNISSSPWRFSDLIAKGPEGFTKGRPKSILPAPAPATETPPSWVGYVATRGVARSGRCANWPSENVLRQFWCGWIYTVWKKSCGLMVDWCMLLIETPKCHEMYAFYTLWPPWNGIMNQPGKLLRCQGDRWRDLWGDRSRGRKSLKVEIGDSLELMYNGTWQSQSYLSFQICTYINININIYTKI